MTKRRRFFSRFMPLVLKPNKRFSEEEISNEYSRRNPT